MLTRLHLQRLILPQLAVSGDRSVGVNRDKYRLSGEHWIPSEQFEIVEHDDIHPRARAPSLSLFLSSLPSLVSLFLHPFSSRVACPRKHTCCANFKSGYTGAITISRARYFTTVPGMQCVLSICVSDIFIHRYFRASHTFDTVAIRQFSVFRPFRRELNVPPTCSFTSYSTTGIVIYFYWNTPLPRVLASGAPNARCKKSTATLHLRTSFSSAACNVS